MKKIITRLSGIYLNLLAYVLPAKTGRDGLNLFCRPIRLDIKDYHKKFLEAADSFNLYFDGIKIQGYRWGKGRRRIVFLHGWQSHTFRWKNYISALSKDDFTIYAIDAPGHGLSDGRFLSVPYYSQVIHQLITTLGEVHAVIAHSLGSFSILHAIHEQPGLPIEKLILTAPPGEASDFISLYQKTLKLSDKTLRLILERFEKRFGQPIEYFSTARFASAVTIPGLIVHDEEDLETPFHYAQKIHAQWPKSELLATKGLGHNLKSNDIVAKIVNYINDPVHVAPEVG